MNHFLRDVIAQKLREDCSPEQISGWLKREYPEDQAMRIPHETIYRTLFVQARGALKRELLAYLRSRRMMRKGRHASTAGQPRGQIKEAVSIRERPPEAEDRAVPGHWEGDLLAGSRNTHVATLVERSSKVRDAGAGWRQGHSERGYGPWRADKAAAQEDRSIRVRSRRPRPDGAEAQHEAPQDFRLQHPGCYTSRGCCAHQLNPPPTVFGSVAQVCTPSSAEARAFRLSDIIQSEERKLYGIPYGERQLYEHGWY